jgi:dihydrofolate synthase/folylpolyglutamate synthase
VNRKPVAEAEVVRLVEHFAQLLKELAPTQPTFFEVTTVMAMQFFAEQNCDLVIWETGLGGRLDATNIVTPIASVITNVQHDHEKWLGNSVTDIAREKAGIIKAGVPVITGCEDHEALQVIKARAKELICALKIAGTGSSIQSALKGDHQRSNAALTVETVTALQSLITVSEKEVREGLARVQWAGRLQSVRDEHGRETLIDGAHNPDGVKSLANFLRQEYPEQRFAFII